MDKTVENAEMTDFASHPDARGRNTALHLLSLQEVDIRQRGMKVRFTIARAISAGMNATFNRAGYTSPARRSTTPTSAGASKA